MVVCRFFQNGYCKFGNQCRFEHSYPNNQNVFNDNRGLFLMQRILVLVLKKAYDRVSSNTSQTPSIFGNNGFSNTQTLFPRSVQTNPNFSFNQALKQIHNPNIYTQPEPMRAIIEDAEMINETVAVNNRRSFLAMHQTRISYILHHLHQRFRFQAHYTQPINTQFKPTVNSHKSFFDTKTRPNSNQNIFSSMSIDHTMPPIQSNPIVENRQTVKNSDACKPIYSKMNELSENDLKNFQSDSFQAPIPICPPPAELCF
ncbi:hypothetical protein SSS_09546 [Sarcoptes scabiei]|uniref:Nucleoporin NUP42 n=1 Tax=Sarcoptes scabiei TaxID=52283 RepID=A0A834RFL9_SARSC|nr:hypothetical protein SSS_09546 [Sarcoptes scabiei]